MIFSKKPSQKKLEEFTHNWKNLSPSWIALQFNSHQYKNSLESYSIEWHSPDLHQLKWGIKGPSVLEIEGWRKSRLILEGELETNKDIQSLINDNLHLTFIKVRESLISCGSHPPKEETLNPKENEGREWLRVTLEVLKKALNEVSLSRDKGGPEVSQGFLFCGTHPNKNRFTFRLRIFNLDFELIEDEIHCLRILVYNKKNNETFDNLEPALTMVFRDHKQNVLNEFIQLLPELGKTLVF